MTTRTHINLGKKTVERISLSSLLLIALSSLALATRFYQLDQWSFWVDEVITVNAAMDVFGNDLFPDYISSRGLSLLLIGATLKLTSVAEGTARLIPALLGALTIPLLYFPIRKAANTFVALSTLVFLTFSHYHLFWSQNARYVSAFILFYSLALLTFYLAFEGDSLPALLGSLVFFALASWERLYGLFFVPVTFGYIIAVFILPLFDRPKGFKFRKMILFISSSILIAIFFAQRMFYESDQWAENFFYKEGEGPLGVLLQFSYQLTIPIVAMTGIAAIYLLLTRRERFPLFIGLGVVVPIAGVMSASLFQYVTDRYMIGSLVFVFILASLGLADLWKQSSRNLKILAIGLIIVLAAEPLLGVAWYYDENNGNWPNWRGALTHVEQSREPGDLIFVNKPPMAGYYLDEDVQGMEQLSPILAATEDNGQQLWFVESKNLSRIHPEVQEWIEGNARVVYDTVGIRVYLYQP